MIDIEEKKRRIISFLETSGPSLPVRIARAIQMEPIFTSAILSELLGSNKIKTSHMKVGASSLYLIPGQEEKLEEHIEHLKSAEKEAYLKLKEKDLKDKDQEPAIRVALRNIKDFAIPYKIQDEIMWKYTFKKEEIKNEPEIKEGAKKEITEKPEKLEDEPEKETPKIESKPEPITKIESKPEPINKPKTKPEQKQLEPIFEEDEEKPEFLNEIKEFLENNKIEFLEEIQSEKKEIVAKVNINSTLGDIHFLMIAKNKKTLSKEEINASLQRAKYNKMPCLLILRKEPSKTVQSIIDGNHMIKLKIMP